MSRLLCFLAVLAAGCAATPSQSGDVTKNIATAEMFVMTAEMTVDTCIALKIPVCTSPVFLAGVRQAKAVAAEALAEAKSFPIDGSTQDKINAALRVAMNAVLLFNSLK